MEIAQNTVTADRQIAPRRGTLIGSDFQTFLKMLTAQIQNQDPLNPMESGDFAVQLATFSGVEQQVRSNDLLAGLGAEISSARFAQIGNWLGREVRAPSPLRFKGEPIDLYVTLPAEADAAELLVFDIQGNLVQKEPVSTDGVHSWVGQSADGTPMPDGTYRFELLVNDDGAMVAGPPVEAFARVVEIHQGTDEITLTLTSGAQISVADVSSVRQPVS